MGNPTQLILSSVTDTAQLLLLPKVFLTPVLRNLTMGSCISPLSCRQAPDQFFLSRALTQTRFSARTLAHPNTHHHHKGQWKGRRLFCLACGHWEKPRRPRIGAQKVDFFQYLNPTKPSPDCIVSRRRPNMN